MHSLLCPTQKSVNTSLTFAMKHVRTALQGSASVACGSSLRADSGSVSGLVSVVTVAAAIVASEETSEDWYVCWMLADPRMEVWLWVWLMPHAGIRGTEHRQIYLPGGLKCAMSGRLSLGPKEVANMLST